MWTLCSIGSNVDPEASVPVALDRLARWFRVVEVSPLIRTRPVGIVGRGDFLNGLVRFQTDLGDADLKQYLNALEIDLGRDRSHPDKKRLPRPLDIDIQDRKLKREALEPSENSPYMRQMWAADSGDLDGLEVWPVDLDGQSFGQEPTAVYFDHRTGEVRVGAQQIDGLQDGLKPALALQQGMR